MKDSGRIVICGDSIYLLAIEFGLCARAEGDVVRIDPDLPNIVEQVSLLDPLAVIIERDRKNDDLALELFCRNIPLIMLDEARHSIMVLVGEHPSKTAISELGLEIDKINRQREVLVGENV
jgi:hypothetical protein